MPELAEHSRTISGHRSQSQGRVRNLQDASCWSASKRAIEAGVPQSQGIHLHYASLEYAKVSEATKTLRRIYFPTYMFSKCSCYNGFAGKPLASVSGSQEHGCMIIWQKNTKTIQLAEVASALSLFKDQKPDKNTMVVVFWDSQGGSSQEKTNTYGK